jgi:hypothetical protein
MRKADDPGLKGDILHVDLFLLTTGPLGRLVPEKQEVSLTASRVFRCWEATGTFFSSDRFSTEDKDLTFWINPNAGLITVETGSGNDKSSWRFEYVKDSVGYHLKEASMVATYYDVTDKRMKSIDWVAIKGKSPSIPWPCPMAITPIYAP